MEPTFAADVAAVGTPTHWSLLVLNTRVVDSSSGASRSTADLNSRIWAVAKSEGGDVLRVGHPTSSDESLFTFMPPIPQKVRGAGVYCIEVGVALPREPTRTERIYLDAADAPDLVPLEPTSIQVIQFLPVLFFVSIFLPLMTPPTEFRHRVLLVLACVFTVVLLSYVVLGARFLPFSTSTGQSLSLGSATIFRGSYSAEDDDQILLSLTEPNLGNTTSRALPIQTGFGAPLWVVFIAILGSSLMTVRLVISEIGRRPLAPSLDPNPAGAEVSDSGNEGLPAEGDEPGSTPLSASQRLRLADQEIVRHQLFMFFAPIGAIFAYQALVMAGATGQPFTVGLAVLTAGATLPELLTRGLRATAEVLDDR